MPGVFRSGFGDGPLRKKLKKSWETCLKLDFDIGICEGWRWATVVPSVMDAFFSSSFAGPWPRRYPGDESYRFVSRRVPRQQIVPGSPYVVAQLSKQIVEYNLAGIVCETPSNHQQSKSKEGFLGDIQELLMTRGWSVDLSYSFCREDECMICNQVIVTHLVTSTQKVAYIYGPVLPGPPTPTPPMVTPPVVCGVGGGGGAGGGSTSSKDNFSRSRSSRNSTSTSTTSTTSTT